MDDMSTPTPAPPDGPDSPAVRPPDALGADEASMVEPPDTAGEDEAPRVEPPIALGADEALDAPADGVVDAPWGPPPESPPRWDLPVAAPAGPPHDMAGGDSFPWGYPPRATASAATPPHVATPTGPPPGFGHQPVMGPPPAAAWGPPPSPYGAPPGWGPAPPIGASPYGGPSAWGLPQAPSPPGIAIAGFVCALVGIVVLPLLLVGLVLSLVGLSQAKKLHAPRGLAIAGVCVSGVFLVLWGIYFALIIIALASSNGAGVAHVGAIPALLGR
jgi:hypothetical protein